MVFLNDEILKKRFNEFLTRPSNHRYETQFLGTYSILNDITKLFKQKFKIVSKKQLPDTCLNLQWSNEP